ncbi:hypothetical protein AGMMS50230_10470 [Spirochaetia bacterium]|nr:hypothetical protein AGMMS50230_10470 [Spirochaetia bacterium]
MKNKLLPVLLVITLALVLGTCESVSGIIAEPSLSFDSVSVTGLNFSGADMLAKISVKNDNPFPIPFPEIDWNLFIRDSSFLSGTVKNNNKIAANSSTIVELPFAVSYEGLYKTAAALLDADEAPYRVDLGARFPLPVLSGKTFTTSHSGLIPMIKMPALSFSGVRFNSLSASRVEFILTWLVDNKNAFALNLDKLDYAFAVNNTSWASGSAPGRLSIPARRTTQVPITVNINSLSMVQEIAAMAAGGKTVNYTCAGEAILSPQGLEQFAALKLPFNYSGSTGLKR